MIPATGASRSAQYPSRKVHGLIPGALLDLASAPYRPAGRFAYFFARGKLGRDPAYRALFERGLLGSSRRVLDLGCGQGLLTAWLRAAGVFAAGGAWPAGWPAPPPIETVRGVELMPNDVARAHVALGADCGVELGDIRHADFGQVDAIVILDVLHYMNDAAQRDVLKRARAAISHDGALLLRVCDTGAGLPFLWTRVVDQLIFLARGHGWVSTFTRSVPQWIGVLREAGFEASPVPMSEGTPFANVLLVARAV